jgi:signal transduction histidine kinase
VYATRYWVEYTGMPLEQAQRMGWVDAIHQQDRAFVMQAWRKAVDSGAPYQVECRLHNAGSGSYRWHVARAVPERSDTGGILSWLGTFTDVHESKQAILARDEFLSIASHELRTPLTALKLRLQSLLYGQEATGKTRRKLESAARQTDRLERLIENLLDVSRITTGHLTLEPEEFDLAEAAREVCERFRESAGESGFVLEVDAAAPVVGCWDRMRVEQVLNNLLSNAHKYGAGKPVSVSVSAAGESAELVVTDHGIGIAPEDMERIFGQFERASNRRAPNGLGIGLYIARQIVQAHGGSVEVQSGVGSGSTFRVALPRRSKSSDDAQRPPSVRVAKRHTGTAIS